MSTSQGRRDPRIPVEVPVRITARGTTIDAVTADVSRRGLFIRTDWTPRCRQLIRLEVKLPGSERWLRLHAMASHLCTAPGRHGFGASLYGVGDEVRAQWVAFIESVRFAVGGEAPEIVDAEPDRAAAGGFDAVLRVKPATEAVFRKMHARLCRDGQLFVRAAARVPVGGEVLVEIVHPRSGQQVPLMGRVARHVRERATCGMVISLRLSRADAAALAALMSGGATPANDQASARVPVTASRVAAQLLAELG